MAPIKGQMLSLQGPREALKRVLFGPGIYLVPREDGLLVVGATSEPEAGFAEGLTPFGQRQLQAGIEALLPEAASWPPMERWWGFRPGTPDEGAPARAQSGPGAVAGHGPLPQRRAAGGDHRGADRGGHPPAGDPAARQRPAA